MKKLFALLITAGCFAAVNVNAQVSDMSVDTATVDVSSQEPNRDRYNSTVAVDKNDLIKIRISELPAMVSQTLGNSDYAGWTITSAYRTKANDQYLVEVKKGTQVRSYWFDKNGNRLENSSGTHKSPNVQEPKSNDVGTTPADK